MAGKKNHNEIFPNSKTHLKIEVFPIRKTFEGLPSKYPRNTSHKPCAGLAPVNKPAAEVFFKFSVLNLGFWCGKEKENENYNDGTVDIQSWCKLNWIGKNHQCKYK